MGSINSYNPKVDQTVQIFDQFYNYSDNVSSLEYDAVYSYLRSVFATADAAGNFAVTMFRIAQVTGIPVMNLLQEIQGLGVPELTLTFAYYLNSFRSSSTLLGLSVQVTPNYYVARNVRS